LTNIGTLGGLV